MKSEIPSLGGFAAEDAAAGDRTVKIGFRINCKDDLPGIPVTINSILDEFAYPEVIIRAKEKRLASNFDLYKVHMVMYDDSKRNEILLNEEVRFVGLVHLVKRERKLGDPISFGEIEDIKALYPSNQNDPNAAHIMLFKFKDRWLLSCDFFYNKEKNQKKLESAKAFFRAAEICRHENLFGPFVDNLFSASELAIQSILLFQPMGKYARRQTHDNTSKLFENYTSLGNLDMKFWNHYIMLRGLRLKARYLTGLHNRNFKLDIRTLTEMVSNTQELLQYVEKKFKSIDLSSKPMDGEYVGFGQSKK